MDYLLATLAGGANQPLWFGMDAWRWMFLMMAIPAIAYGLLATTIPESPRYLVATHRIPEARKVLTQLLGEKNLAIKVERIRASLERETEPSWRDLRSPAGRVYPIVWIGLGTMAVIFGTADTSSGSPALVGAAGPIALVAANLFVVFFGMSWGPVVWVLLGEMFPNRIRAAALSLAAAGQWAANWLITVSFPALKDFSLGLAYGLYAVFALLSLLFVAKFVPETKGKTLEDMDAAIGH